jgi:DNA (cytosine-5)-methyltransferase 1
VSRPLLLDLYCGAGGAAVGYWRAGFDVVGVDLARQPRYPFPFIQGDALDVARWVREVRPDVVHASPPCQAYSQVTAPARARGIRYPDLYDATRRQLQEARAPYVLENVPLSPAVGVTLCGTGFGLGVVRHRVFEASIALGEPPPCSCSRGIVARGGYVTVAGEGVSRGRFVPLLVASVAMGISWMRTAELCEAVPPAYTTWVGERMAQVLGLASPDGLRRPAWLPAEALTCRQCGQPLPSAGTGRPAEFCRQRCRQAAFRARRKAIVDGVSSREVAA